jgi:sterol desaturase/sphingolipid hydroxylase (fatty acid hydroxylase superfamily)
MTTSNAFTDDTRGLRWRDRLAKILAAPFDWIERGVVVALTAPVKPLWRKLDAYSYKFENTLASKIIAVSLFPLLMVGTVIFGFAMLERGLTMDAMMFSTLFFVGLGLVFGPLERLMPWSRNWLHRQDSGTDVLLMVSAGLWQPLLGPISLFLTAWLVAWLHQQIPPNAIRDAWPTALHPVLQVFLLIAVMDFFRYWYHRWMHETPFMWRWHSVHHSSTRLYWFNGVRSHPVEGFVSNIIWVIPYALIQAPAGIVFVAALVSRVIGRFQHTNIDAKLGPFEYIFSGPENHRYHHAKSIEEGNTNYGGDIILWDHLFGTFYLPKGRKPSDDIGVGGIPDFPQSWFGLMLAPFMNSLWRSGGPRRPARVHGVEPPADALVAIRRDAA